MAYSWRILRSAVEQEILFPSEAVYEDYLLKLCQKDEPFEIVSEMAKADGSYIVVMRKRYNNNPFYRLDDEDEDFKEWMMAVMGGYHEEFLRKMEEKEPDFPLEPSPELKQKLMDLVHQHFKDEEE